MTATVPPRTCNPVSPRRNTGAQHRQNCPRWAKQVAGLYVAALLGVITPHAHAETLADIFKLAKTNDAQLNSARAQLQAEREKYPQARAALLPQVNASFLRQDQTSEFTPQGAPTNRAETSPETRSLTLVQPLFRWQAFESFEQSKLLVAKAEIDYKQAEQDLTLRVAQAYFDILAARDTIAVIERQKAAITEQLAAAKRNFEVGTATITDQQEAQARFDLALAQEIAARNDLDIKRAALQNIIGGSKVPALAPLRGGSALPPLEPGESTTWVRKASDSNLSVMAVKLLGEVARRETSKARGGHLPTVDLVASQTRNANSRFGTTTATIETSAVGVQVNIPIFAGLGTQARVEETLRLQEKAAADFESAQRNAAQAARQTHAGVLSGLAQINALQAAEKSSKLALESNKLGYQVGVRINIDVLNAQQQLSSTQRDLAKAKYDTLLNSLRLKAAVGALQETDVLEVSNLLDNAAEEF